MERFDTGVAGLHARIDSVRAELREEFASPRLQSVIAVLAANTKIVTIIATVATITGILVAGGGFAIPPFGAP